MSKVALYKAIRDRLKTGIPELFIDMNKGQFLKPADHYPVPLPAALISFGRVGYDTMLQGESHGKCTVTVSLFVDNSADSFDGAEQEEASLTMLEMQDSIFQLLEGLNDDNAFQRLTRTGESEEFSARLLCFKTDFATKLLATKKGQKVEVVTDLKVRSI